MPETSDYQTESETQPQAEELLEEELKAAEAPDQITQEAQRLFQELELPFTSSDSTESNS